MSAESVRGFLADACALLLVMVRPRRDEEEEQVLLSARPTCGRELRPGRESAAERPRAPLSAADLYWISWPGQEGEALPVPPVFRSGRPAYLRSAASAAPVRPPPAPWPGRERIA